MSSLPGPLDRLKRFLGDVPWLGALLPACVVLVSGGWVADGLKGEVLFAEWMNRWGIPMHWWPGMVFAGLCFLGFTLVLYRNRRAFVPMLNLSRHKCDAHRSLVLFVSPHNLKPELSGSTDRFPITVKRDSHTRTIEGECLNKDIKALDGLNWNWQQMLRAIQPHADALERLHLIGSPDSGRTPGSHSQLGVCRTMLERYLPEGVKVAQAEPVDFEDFNALHRCLRGIIRREKEAGLKDEDIVIDVTGGQKTTSIAGATITFNTSVTFQYVQTRPPFEVYAYDVIHLSHQSADG